MRYIAQRIRTGEWVHKDLPLAEGERTRELSGPGQLTGKIEPGLRSMVAEDGLRILEPWGTAIYPVDDYGQIANKQGFLVVPPDQHEETSLTITAPGFLGYAAGSIYNDAISFPPFSDPLVIARYLWTWLQEQPQSNLGMTFAGTLTSDRIIGNNEEPYALAWYDAPDVGSSFDDLAAFAPFDFTEEHEWADDTFTTVQRRIRFGYPRIGAPRPELRYALGENIIETVPFQGNEDFANHIIGIGNGDGSEMITAEVHYDDGLLRRTRVFTDKTVTNSEILEARCRALLTPYGQQVDIASIKVRDHREAPLSSVAPGDDIFVETYLPTYGEIAVWLRIVGITESDDEPGIATFSTVRSNTFRYNSNEGVNS